jgi:hypothetical protein
MRSNPLSFQPAGGPSNRLFVLGAGRSGTSLLTGLFRLSGLHMGDAPYAPRQANPHGFFEDREVNSINEALLARCLPQRVDPGACGHGHDVPGEGQRWLARLPPEITPQPTADLSSRISAVLAKGATCLKDPRFCYTLPAWWAALEPGAQVRHLCVFRHPSVVAASVLHECRSTPYLANLAISPELIFANWCLMYRHVLEKHANNGEWLFVAYDSLFETSTLDRIEAFSGHGLDRGLVDPALNRSRAELIATPAAEAIYQQLLERSQASGAGVPFPGVTSAPPTGVVIWHVGRCGSSVLGQCLNQHPAIQEDNEILNRWMPQQRGDQPLPELETALETVRSGRRKPVQIVEIKFLAAQHPGLFGLDPLALADRLSAYGWQRHVVLERSNLLRRMVSHCIGQQTRRFHLSASEAKPDPQAITLPLEAITVGLETRSLLDWLDIMTLGYGELRQGLGMKGGYLDVIYEKHLQSDPLVGYRLICEDLGLPAVNVRVGLQRTNPYPLEALIVNFEELNTLLAPTVHGWMLTEPCA